MKQAITVFVWLMISVSAWTDHRNHYVYDIFPIMGIIVQVVYGWMRHVNYRSFREFLVFAAVQLFLFSRMYGFGDVLVFILCGTFCISHGHTFFQMLWFMLGVFGLLGVVQCCKRNIAPNGNLKQKVPLVPYIAVCCLWFLM